MGLFQNDSVSNCERVVQDRYIIFTHGLAEILTITPVRMFGMCWKGSARWSDSPIINTRCLGKINATHHMDGNKSCDIAKDNQNNAIANENCNKSLREIYILESVTFLWPSNVRRGV